MAISPRQAHQDVVQKADDLDIKVARLSTEFAGFQITVNKGFVDIHNAIDSLARDAKERARPQWQIFIGFGVLMLGVIGGLVSIGYTPIRDNETKLEQSLDRSNNNMADIIRSTVSEKEFNQYVQFNKDKGDNRYERIVADHNSNVDRIKKLEQDIVPFRENELHWNSQMRSDQDMQRQIDAVRETVSGIYTPKDAIARLERRADELDTLIAALRAKAKD